MKMPLSTMLIVTFLAISIIGTSISAYLLYQQTNAVLTNAVYFKGEWAAPFDAKDTKDEDFSAAGRKVPTRCRFGGAEAQA